MNLGCLMVDFNIIWSWNIPKKYLHENGISKRPHCTILYGFTEDPDLEWFKSNLRPITDYSFKVCELQIFRNDKFDVLSYKLESLQASEANMFLKTQFAVETEFQYYKPHLTLAYFKKGQADRYLKPITSTVIKPNNYRYSTTQDEDLIF